MTVVIGFLIFWLQYELLMRNLVINFQFLKILNTNRFAIFLNVDAFCQQLNFKCFYEKLNIFELL